MFQRPVVVGVTQVKNWGLTETVADVFAKLGHNTGNMIFTEALLRVISRARRVSFSLSAQELESADAIVIAAANWINDFEDYGWLANAIERTKLPVFLIGVGAQAGLNCQIPNVCPGTLRLLQIVSERSTLIAARGPFTSEVLAHYGIKNSAPVGCPSLLLAGTRGPKLTDPPSEERIVLHGTRHGFNRCGALQSWLYRSAYRNDWDLILQSELADAYYALGKTNNAKILARAEPVIRDIYHVNDISDVADYLRRRGKLITHFEAWLDYVAQRTFCVGSRIHATIAALIAGTPATLIVHDARTLELATTMGIPHIMAKNIALDGEFPMAELREAFSRSREFKSYHMYYRAYKSLFAANALEMSDVGSCSREAATH
jgi:hypothetical protein